jgi:hypothetical protein
VRTAALSVGVAGVAAVVAVPLSLGGGTGPPGAAGAGPPTPKLLVSPLKSVPWPWSALTLNGRPPKDADGKAAEPWFEGKLPDLGYQVAGAAYWPRGTKGEPYSEEGPMVNVFVHPVRN